MALTISLDFQSSSPIFQQIVDGFERKILVGELREGEFIPSVRDFAISTRVNPNTVAKAYQQLQSMGLLEPVRGKGLIVKNISDQSARRRREEIMSQKISEVLTLASSLKLSAEDIVDLIKKIERKKP